MASVQNFIKWFKERTRKQNKPSPQASIMRLGKLPPVPPRDEYGFSMKNTEQHIYEEIRIMTSDEELESLKSSDEVAETCDETISQTLQQKFDFTHAKEIGPYLVVPIVSDIRGDGNESCDSGAGDLADLILSGSLNDSRDSNSNTNTNVDTSNTKCSTPRTDATYDYSKSLYNSIPAWARAKLKDVQCKRHGLALQEGKGKAKEISQSHDDTFHEYSINDVSSISSCSDHMFSRGQRSKLTNRCCGSSDSSDSAKTFSEYDIDNYDDAGDDRNYEYFLVKAEKNFLLEQELKKYVDETTDYSLSSSSQSDSMSLTTVTSMSDLSTILAPGLSRSNSDIRMSDESGDASLLSDSSCYCCRGQENSLFCAKASKSVNSVLLVHKTPRRDRKEKSARRNRSGSREREKSRDSSGSRKDSKSNGAYHGSRNAARRRSLDDILSSKSPSRRRSVDDIAANTSKTEYKFTRSNTMPVKELEKQIRKDMRKLQKENNDRHDRSRKQPKDTEKSRKHPKEYKLPSVSNEYVFSTDSEYKFCTISNSKSRSSLSRTHPGASNPGLNRNSDRYSCRATDFVLKKSGRVTTGATVPTDDTYGSIYGTLHGRASQAHCQNRLLGDMMRMNHDRQLFF